MNVQNRAAKKEGAGAHRRLLRISSYSVASVLAMLMVSAVLPPLVADQSDRALVNAPVTLLTAPIAGDVEDIAARPGQEVERGATIARLSNARVDRSTLIQLEGKAAETRERALAAEQKRLSNVEYLNSLDRSISEQASHSGKIFAQQITELKARLAASVSSGQEKKTILDRQASMVSRSAASPEMVKPTQQQYEAALHQKDAETAKLAQKSTQLEGLSKGVFVGEDLAGLATLSQKRRDIAFDTQRLEIERSELQASLRDQQKPLDAERQRLDKLAAMSVEAPIRGEILSVGAAATRWRRFSIVTRPSSWRSSRTAKRRISGLGAESKSADRTCSQADRAP